jgi:hypothetical protein
MNIKHIQLGRDLALAILPARSMRIITPTQGGSLAILAAMSYPRRLAGCINFSGWVIERCFEDRFAISDANTALHLLWWHGDQDAVRTIDFALLSLFQTL